MKKAIKTACCMVLMGVMCLMSVSPGMTTGARVTTGSPSYRVTEEERDRFFGKSAIIGNSIGLGLKYYFATKEDGYLGNPQMLVWGCYSFINDFTNIEKYMIHYQGSPMKARDAVKACGAQHVFINMGTNDFNTSQSQTFSHYKRLIREIKNTNPDVDIFILGTTPTRIGKGLLNNSEINKLNDQMSSLAERRSNMYYIDINTPMKDSEGRLRADYASDGFVHLSTTAYQTWTSTMVRYVRQLLRREKKAKYQVRQAEKKLSQETYDKAAEAVAELENSSLKKELKQRLRTVRKRWEELQAATPTPMIATGGSVTGFAVAGVEEPVTVTGPAVSPIPTLIPTPTPTTDPNELTDLEQRKADYFSTHRITRLRTEKQVEKRVRLKWKKQFGADDYSVYRSEDKDDG